MTRVFTAKTGTGASTDKIVSTGRQMTAFVSGTFDATTVKVQVSPDAGTTWVDAPGEPSFTAAGAKNFFVARDSRVRLNVTAAGATSSIDAWLGDLVN